MTWGTFSSAVSRTFSEWVSHQRDLEEPLVRHLEKISFTTRASAALSSKPVCLLGTGECVATPIVSKMADFTFSRPFRIAGVFEAALRMIADIAEPLHVTRIAFVVRLLHAAARDDPFELRKLVDHENVAKGFGVGDTTRLRADAIGSADGWAS